MKQWNDVVELYSLWWLDLEEPSFSLGPWKGAWEAREGRAAILWGFRRYSVGNLWTKRCERVVQESKSGANQRFETCSPCTYSILMCYVGELHVNERKRIYAGLISAFIMDAGTRGIIVMGYFGKIRVEVSGIRSETLYLFKTRSDFLKHKRYKKTYPISHPGSRQHKFSACSGRKHSKF